MELSGHGTRERRGELIERSFAHMYETGGMRRTHLRGRDNIKKRLLVHASAFNLSLVLRSVIGKGTPRGLQGRKSIISNALSLLLSGIRSILVIFDNDTRKEGEMELLKAQVSVNYKSIVVTPYHEGDNLRFSIENKGNTDLELLQLEVWGSTRVDSALL